MNDERPRPDWWFVALAIIGAITIWAMITH